MSLIERKERRALKGDSVFSEALFVRKFFVLVVLISFTETDGDVHLGNLDLQ